MTKVKARFKQFVPRGTLLSNATDEEVFTEFMKRVVEKTGGRPVCYFMDAFNDRKQYDIHHASDDMFFPVHTTILKTNKF